MRLVKQLFIGTASLTDQKMETIQGSSTGKGVNKNVVYSYKHYSTIKMKKNYDMQKHG